MTKNNTFKTASLITSALSLALVTTSSIAFAKDNNEQCAGVVRAGSNDCASAEHICAGMNSDDGSDTDWLWLPTGTCSKIVGAHILEKPSKSSESEKKPTES